MTKKFFLFFISLWVLVGSPPFGQAQQETNANDSRLIQLENLARFRGDLGRRISVRGLLKFCGKDGLCILLMDGTNDAIAIEPVPPAKSGTFTERESSSQLKRLMKKLNDIWANFGNKRVVVTGKLSYMPFELAKHEDQKARQAQTAHLYFSTLDAKIELDEN